MKAIYSKEDFDNFIESFPAISRDVEVPNPFDDTQSDIVKYAYRRIILAFDTNESIVYVFNGGDYEITKFSSFKLSKINDVTVNNIFLCKKLNEVIEDKRYGEFSFDPDTMPLGYMEFWLFKSLNIDKLSMDCSVMINNTNEIEISRNIM